MPDPNLGSMPGQRVSHGFTVLTSAWRHWGRDWASTGAAPDGQDHWPALDCQWRRLDRRKGEPFTPIPTEPVGSVPRPQAFLDASAAWLAGQLPQQAYDALCDELVRETIAAFEATGSPIVTDGEQTKVSFVGYPLDGLTNQAPHGLRIEFADDHHRALPRLTLGPFRYER